MDHELKTWPEAFDAIKRGDKTHEVRISNERDFNTDDTLHLRRWDPKKKRYTGQDLHVKVTYCQDLGIYNPWLRGVFSMSIRKLNN